MNRQRNSRRRQPRVVVISPALHEELTQIKKRSGRNISWLVEEGMRAYIRNYPLSGVQNA